MPEVLDPPKPLPTADFYQLIHEQISNEDSSMNQRINWLVVSQSFLFSVFATLLSSPPDPESDYADLHHLLLWVIPSISLVVSILIYVGIVVSLVYMADLRKVFQTYPQDNSTEYFPPIQGTPLTRRLAQVPAIAVPFLFIVTWVVLLIQLVH